MGINEPDWKQIGEAVLAKPLEGHVSPTEFYHKWSTKCQPSWKALTEALGQLGTFTWALAAAETARKRQGDVQGCKAVLKQPLFLLLNFCQKCVL